MRGGLRLWARSAERGSPARVPVVSYWLEDGETFLEDVHWSSVNQSLRS